MPFLNAEKFMQEAVRSVFAQGYDNWELLLVDDGSTDSSSELAQGYAAQNPRRVRYLEHPGHQNHGISESRNLGLGQAKGKYIAFLDADDVWLPHKLERQVAVMKSHPQAGMCYGLTQYWYSWTEKMGDRDRDYVQMHNIRADRLIKPPSLFTFFLESKAAVPCINSVLVREELLKLIGQFEGSFHDMYEDQVFYAKMSLRFPVYISNECWDRYRQHPNSVCSVMAQSGQTRSQHLLFLRWLKGYLLEHGFESSDVWKALQKELRYYENPRQLTMNNVTRYLARRSRKLWLRVVGQIRSTSLTA
jgi:glycosyltransferase involved in cell wall biosynthesis